MTASGSDGVAAGAGSPCLRPAGRLSHRVLCPWTVGFLSLCGPCAECGQLWAAPSFLHSIRSFWWWRHKTDACLRWIDYFFLPYCLLGCCLCAYKTCCGANHSLFTHSFKKIFFFFIKFVFNWRIIALQCCVNSCHTSTWISHKYTYVPSFLNSPSTFLSSRLSQSSLSHTSNSHWLSILHMVVCMFPCYSICPMLSFLLCVHESVLYVYTSTAALKIGLSVPSF